MAAPYSHRRQCRNEVFDSARAVLPVGDGENDIGMLRAAGVSVAFQPKTDRVRRAAKHLVKDRLDEVLRFVPPFQETADS